MKVNTLLKVWLLLFTFILLPGTQAENEAVLDSKGRMVLTTTRYNILPAVRGFGGGLDIEPSRDNRTCAGWIIQETNKASIGFPVLFAPSNVKQHPSVVRVSTDLSIDFVLAYVLTVSGPCTKGTPRWQVGPSDLVKKQTFVTTGGEFEGRGRDRTLFKTERIGADYYFRFCPSVCRRCKVICRNIGIYEDDGVRRLALSDAPFRVKIASLF